MSTRSFLSRIPRSVGAGGAALALIGAGLLAPQAASASYYPWTPSYSTCVDAALPTLVAGGQAVKRSGARGPGYYATGSGDYLGSSSSASAALGQVSPGVWKKFPICR